MPKSTPKYPKRKRSNVVDHISNLPDVLVGHILSFIPTKFAVKTSILSKRWKYLWTKVPALDFTEMPSSSFNGALTRKQKIEFWTFVDTVLLHNDNSYLRHLCLRIFPVDDDFHVSSRLDAMTRRKIHEIYMLLSSFTSKSLPLLERLLSCEKLVVLKLDCVQYLEVPMSFHLPSLETIHLTGLCAIDNEFMKYLSSGCPLLKQILIDCLCNGTLHVEILGLTTLIVGRSINIIIKSPNIRCLHLKGKVRHYGICNLSSLVEANLHFDHLDDHMLAFEILSKVSRVKTLQLGGFGDQLMTAQKPPTFWNLTCLEFNLVHEVAQRILKFTPMLKCLIVKEVLTWKFTLESTSDLKCLSCLENVKIRCFKGEKEGMKFVAYFLKAASVLKVMKIIFDHIITRKKQRYFLQKVETFPRSSSQVRVRAAEI